MREPTSSGRILGLGVQVARAWSAYIMIMGGYWTAGGAGYPFGRADPTGPGYGSILTGVDAPDGGPVIVVVGLGGLLLASVLEHHRPRIPARRRTALVAGVGYACFLVTVAVDGRALLLLPPLGQFNVAWLSADWPTLFQMTVPVAAASFVLATVAMARRTADRSPAGLARTSRWSRRWDRIGRVAAYVAMLSPVPYAILRLCWSRGWAIGAPEPFVEGILRVQPENVWIEPILASMALTGSALTYGLVSRWGRVFPRWFPILRGKPVPLWFPLTLGGSAVIGIWSFSRGMLLGRLGVELPGGLSEFQTWGMTVSGWQYWGADGLAWILWPLWSISLAVALVGYYHRRRLVDDDPPRAADVALPVHQPSTRHASTGARS